MAQSMAVLGLQHYRSRLAGEALLLTEQKKKKLAMMETLTKELSDIELRLTEVTNVLGAVTETAKTVFNLALPEAVARRTVKKNHFLPWGGVTGLTLQCLRYSTPRPLTTDDIAKEICLTQRLQLEGNDYKRLKASIRSNLKRLNREGVVHRVGAPQRAGGRHSAWVLADTAE